MSKIMIFFTRVNTLVFSGRPFLLHCSFSWGPKIVENSAILKIFFALLYENCQSLQVENFCQNENEKAVKMNVVKAGGTIVNDEDKVTNKTTLELQLKTQSAKLYHWLVGEGVVIVVEGRGKGSMMMTNHNMCIHLLAGVMMMSIKAAASFRSLLMITMFGLVRMIQRTMLMIRVVNTWLMMFAMPEMMLPMMVEGCSVCCMDDCMLMQHEMMQMVSAMFLFMPVAVLDDWMQLMMDDTDVSHTFTCGSNNQIDTLQ